MLNEQAFYWESGKNSIHLPSYIAAIRSDRFRAWPAWHLDGAGLNRERSCIHLDIPRSRDGVPIIFHDQTLKEACGIDLRIADMDAEQIAKVTFLHIDHAIITLDRALRECRALSLGIMRDVKAGGNERFYQTLADLIRQYRRVWMGFRLIPSTDRCSRAKSRPRARRPPRFTDR